MVEQVVGGRVGERSGRADVGHRRHVGITDGGFPLVVFPVERGVEAELGEGAGLRLRVRGITRKLVERRARQGGEQKVLQVGPVGPERERPQVLRGDGVLEADVERLDVHPAGIDEMIRDIDVVVIIPAHEIVEQALRGREQRLGGAGGSGDAAHRDAAEVRGGRAQGVDAGDDVAGTDAGGQALLVNVHVVQRERETLDGLG